MTAGDGGLTRRRTLLGGLGLASGLGVAAGAASAGVALDLENPRERARIRAKIVASAAEETVPAFYRLHVFAYLNEGTLVPLYTMNNVVIRVCRPLANGHTLMTTYEAGVLCRFDTHEVAERWQNPVTGEWLESWEFIGRPVTVEIGPDAVITGPGAHLKPQSMAIETVGDTVILPTRSDYSYPNPFTPEEFPTESSGPTVFWDSHYVYFSPLAAVADPQVLRAPASIQFQNLVSFQPWLGMGSRPGRSWGRALGAKLRSLDEIPAAARGGLEQRTPMLFDLARWPADRDETAEYRKRRKARSPAAPNGAGT